MRKITVLIGCLIILLEVLLSLQVFSQSYESKRAIEKETTNQVLESGIGGKRIDLNLTNATLLEVTSKLAVFYQIPIGVELRNDSRKKLQQNINIKSGSLNEVLDSLISQNPDYKWEMYDNVVNISPANSRDKFLEDLLETQITKFVLKREIDKFEIRDSIVDLPEIKNLLKLNNVESLNRSYPYNPKFNLNDRIDLSILNTTVRGVLNKVVINSENKIWVVERIGENKEFLLVSF